MSSDDKTPGGVALAADLFGSSSDSTLDFFAAPAPAPSSNDSTNDGKAAHSDTHASASFNDAADLFGSSTSDSLFDQGVSNESNSNTYAQSASSSTYTHVDSSSSSSVSNSYQYPAYDTNQNQTQDQQAYYAEGYYDTSGQWVAYGTGQTQAGSIAVGQSQNPYAPLPSSTPSYNASASAYTGAQYTPQNQYNGSSYAPQTTGSAAWSGYSSYDASYHATPPTNNTAYTTNGSWPATTPAATTTSYVKPNAYDPPVIPLSRKTTPTVHKAYVSSPPNPYASAVPKSAYTTPTPALPPPPQSSTYSPYAAKPAVPHSPLPPPPQPNAYNPYAAVPVSAATPPSQKPASTPALPPVKTTLPPAPESPAVASSVQTSQNTPKAHDPYAPPPKAPYTPSVSPYTRKPRMTIDATKGHKRQSSLLSPHLPPPSPPVDLSKYRTPSYNAYDPPVSVPLTPKRTSTRGNSISNSPATPSRPFSSALADNAYPFPVVPKPAEGGPPPPPSRSQVGGSMSRPGSVTWGQSYTAEPEALTATPAPPSRSYALPPPPSATGAPVNGFPPPPRGLTPSVPPPPQSSIPSTTSDTLQQDSFVNTEPSGGSTSFFDDPEYGDSFGAVVESETQPLMADPAPTADTPDVEALVANEAFNTASLVSQDAESGDSLSAGIAAEDYAPYPPLPPSPSPYEDSVYGAEGEEESETTRLASTAFDQVQDSWPTDEPLSTEDTSLDPESALVEDVTPHAGDYTPVSYAGSHSADYTPASYTPSQVADYAPASHTGDYAPASQTTDYTSASYAPASYAPPPVPVVSSAASYDPYAPSTASMAPPTTSYKPSAYSPYAPPPVAAATTLPPPPSKVPIPGLPNPTIAAEAPYNPYAPTVGAPAPAPRPMFSPPKPPQPLDGLPPASDSYGTPSYGSSYESTNQFTTTTLESTYDPYRPSAQSSQPSQGYQPAATDPYARVPTSLPPPTFGTSYQPATTPAYTVPSAINSAYVPPVSTTAADDPRTSARIPIFHFGFGGNVASCFHSQLDVSTGFDVSLAGRRSAPIVIRKLHTLIPSSALETSSSEFPGPLFTGSSASAISIGRATGAAASKSKKAPILKYLTERADEVERGLNYISTAKENEAERRSAQGKVVLLRLLSVLIENDGKLSGSPAIDSQVRAAIIPPGGASFLRGRSNTGSGPSVVPTTFIAGAADPYGTLSSDKEAPIATYHLRASALDKIQSFLLAGERREACHYALDQKMWAHALLIASSLDKDTWKEVTNEFIRSELGVPVSDSKQGPSNGRESLRVAYSLFSGQGVSSIQELLPPKNLVNQAEKRLMPPLPPMLQATPVSPNFPKPAVVANISSDILSTWPETASTIISNSTSGEHSSALTALGDYLISNNWVEAAHVCYLLSPQTSPVNGIGAASVRVVLLGIESPSIRRNFHTELDPIRFTEVVEFALSLIPPVGKETFGGLPHLQAYKLLRAAQLAEMGYVKEATKYCEAIQTVLKSNPRSSPYFTPTLLEQYKELQARLSGAPMQGSRWLGRKMSKPSMDSLSSWGFSAFTKLIEGDESPLPQETTRVNGEDASAQIGPFSHFDQISEAPSPTGSTASFGLPTVPSPYAPPPRRSGSAMSNRSIAPNPPINRAASAIGYLQPRTTSPAPRVFSAGPATTTFQSATGRFPNNSTVFTPTREPLGEADESGDAGGWWNGGQSNSYGEDANGATPTAMTFQHGNAELEDTGNFVSLMDTYVPTPSPRPSNGSTPVNHANNAFDDEEDDLGFGNSAHKKRVEPKAEDKVEEKKDATPPPAQEATSEPPRSASGSWLRGWWGSKKSDAPAPVRANLGESKTSFYYDKDLKRWVNGKEGDSAKAAPAAPPPPPSRAQTASPSRATGPPASSAPPPPSGTPPPPRAQSAMGLTPPSSLRGPSGLSNSFTPDSDGSGLTPPAPPASRARSAQGQRKNARSRYVDVFATPPPS